MKRSAAVLFPGILAAAFAGCLATEDKKEHPEHPHEHPSGKLFDLKKEYTTAVNSHISDAVAGSGSFKVYDESLKSEWGLELVRIHDDKIVGLGKDRYFACADFKDPASGKIIDLDFYATRRGEEWSIEPALIHKVEGQPRFTYDGKNNRIPAQGR